VDVSETGSEADLRDRAVASLKRKQAFKGTLLAYVLINAVLVLVWALSGGGEFWPGWVMGFWAIGLAFQGYDAYGRGHDITEHEVADEMERMRGR
jgi:cobalamin biosynthesis protein CobD/CbiB